ncbi:MAG: SDR family oxidoreductase [Gammaproteobacteria bacterium]
MGDSLKGKRVFITQCEEFMGAPLRAAFEAYGSEVHADPTALTDTADVAAIVQRAGEIDILVANLAVPAPSTPVEEVTDREWRDVFAHLVDPLPKLMRAVLPQMIARKAGKIVVMGSATAFRGQRRTSTYSAARGAQVSYVRAVGAEIARHNVQINLIAQNFVENPTYYPEEVQALDKFQARLKAEVPAGRLATAEEDAQFAVFLASSEINFFVGQSIPFSGGWVT